MKKVKLTKESIKGILEHMLKRSPASYPAQEQAVAEILENVRNNGDEALFGYTKKFDQVELTADTIQVTEEEVEEAYAAIEPELIEVIRKALVRIRAYHEKQKQNSWFDTTEDGTMLIEKSYAAGDAIDLKLPEYSGDGPRAQPEELVGPGGK